MLIFGDKCKYPSNGRPVFGAIRLITNAQKRVFQSGKMAGKQQWSAIGVFESPPKGQRAEGNSVQITTKFNTSLAEKLIEFSRGEMLLVAGFWEKDEWRSSKEGKTVYCIVAEFVIAQPDYSQFYADGDRENESWDEMDEDVGF